MMANLHPKNKCEVDGDDECKREVRALCYHCSKNLCQVHFRQHSQLVENETCRRLNSFADAFNELSARFDALSISSDILEKPFAQIEQWRVDSHAKIDQMAENTRREITAKIDEYRKVFPIKNKEQDMKIKAVKTMIQQLIQDADASSKQIDDLQASIDETKTYLTFVNTHAIQVDTCPLLLSVNICPKFYDPQPVNNIKLREFNVNYIRLNGIVRRYSIKTKTTGTIKDLINSFVRQSSALERVIRSELEVSYTTDLEPKQDFVLATQIYDHKFLKTYVDDDRLDSILDQDEIVFYEMPYPLADDDNHRILMPCLFQRLPEKQPFAWPILFVVPRHQCRGQDVLDALRAAIGQCFPIDPVKDQQLYDATLQFTVPGRSSPTTTALNDALKDSMNFNNIGTSLIVNIDGHAANIYEENMTN